MSAVCTCDRCGRYIVWPGQGTCQVLFAASTVILPPLHFCSSLCLARYTAEMHSQAHPANPPTADVAREG